MTDVPMSGRRAIDESAYQQAKRDQATKTLAEEDTIKSWEHWRLINNRFPYTIIYQKHQMLLPIRQVASWSDLTEDEQAEFWLIVDTFIEPDYDLWFVNTNKRRSVLSHFHVHLATYHNNREDMQL